MFKGKGGGAHGPIGQVGPVANRPQLPSTGCPVGPHVKFR